MILEKQKKTIYQLQAEKNGQHNKLSEAHNEVTQLNSQMNELKKRVSQLNPGTDFLEKILGDVPRSRNECNYYRFIKSSNKCNNFCLYIFETFKKILKNK
jgi:uncharacterized coiled-coil DUF342 family protein